MSNLEIIMTVIIALLFSILYELERIRQAVQTTRDIAWKRHFGDPYNG